MTYLLTLGGSLLAPKGGPNLSFLLKFKSFIEARLKLNEKFILVVGGGNVAREYIEIAKKIQKTSNYDLDNLGIKATHLNAYLLKSILSKFTHEQIVLDPSKKEEFKKPILIAGGYKPGWSTDYVATVLAKEYSISKIINLSNIDYIYDSDPNLNKRAKKIEKMSWADYRKIIAKKWVPGLKTPFDPVASSLAQRLNIELISINGKKFKNLENLLNQKKFKASIISNEF